MSTLELRAINKVFGATHVIHDVDLSVENGDFVVFVGPSGCGKSTLLRIIAGLETATSGQVLIDGQDVVHVAAAHRGCAMVFQSYALYPHMSVYANMAFGLENLKVPTAEIQAQVDTAAKLLRLDGLLDRKPTQLSGGQRQRVAIGRAIVRKPKIFLFDEPLSNLDAELRVSMRGELRELHDRLNATMIYVTHDQVEAMTLATKIVVLRSGRVEQIGTPKQLFDTPRNAFVAGFIGSPRMNFVSRKNLSGLNSLNIDPPAGAETLGIRPEHLRVHPPTNPRSDPALEVTVNDVEYLGGTQLVRGTMRTDAQIEAILPTQHPIKAGDRVALTFDRRDVHWFDAQGLRCP
jgi:ABC-type sugar transport system ATPase subunit